MSAAHTPGPWSVELDAQWPELFHLIRGPAFKISYCRHANGVGFEAKQKRDADARLISAAPELLAALKRALFVLESPLLNTIPVNGGGAVNAVRAAIAKAEGMG